MAALSTRVYNLLFKRTSTFLYTILVGTFVLERTIDVTSDGLFERINKGKLWKDIKHKYENKE